LLFVLQCAPQNREDPRPSQELTIEEIFHILVRAEETAKHDTKTQENRQHFNNLSGTWRRLPSPK
jgi:hypothetical protein